MLKAKVFLFTTVVIVLQLKCVFTEEENAAELYNVKKTLFGTWHLVGTVRYSNHEILPCITEIINETKNHEYLLTSATVIDDGIVNNYNWLVAVSTMKMRYFTANNGQYYFVSDNYFDVFTDKHLMVQYNISHEQPYTIFSRTPTVDTDLLKNYTSTAEKNKWSFQYVNIGLCRPRNETQKKIDKELSHNILGMWFGIHKICSHVSAYKKEHLLLEMFVKKHDNYLKIIFRQEIAGKRQLPIMDAIIFHNQFHVIDHTMFETPIYDITFNDNNNEVRLKNTNNDECETVWSRREQSTSESLDRYQAIAKEEGWELLTIGG